MARLYADEQFPRIVVKLLRELGHDILTVQEAGKANQRIPDEEVLAFAISDNRAVLTINRSDFIRLHNLQPNHTGIIVCTEDLNRQRLATQIHEALINTIDLTNKLIRINRPSK
jgi:predicted nuclease of predicted toxin-antitoxin system